MAENTILGFTQKNFIAIFTIFCIAIMYLGTPNELKGDVAKYAFSSAVEVTETAIIDAIENNKGNITEILFDLGLGGSPWQTEKTADYIINVVATNNYILNGSSGAMWFYGASEGGILDDIRGNMAGEDLYVNDIFNVTGYCNEIDNLPTEHSVGKYRFIQAGEALVFGDLLYIETDGDYNKADADATGTMRVVGMAAMDISNGAWGMMLLKGTVNDPSLSLTIGGDIYTGLTPGELTQTAPSGSGDQVQRIGEALTATIWFFDPDSTEIEIA